MTIFNSGILFDFDSCQLRNASERNLINLAETLNKYKDTEILLGNAKNYTIQVYVGLMF